MEKKTILEIDQLSISFFSDKKENEVIHNISYKLYKNEILGIVGESGSGKSVSSLAILGLLPKHVSKITHGQILFDHLDLTKTDNNTFRKIRGNKIAVIFQEPMSSLNPSMTCGEQVQEILFEHTNLSEAKAKQETLNLFEKVKLPNTNRVFDSYPHEISGGQKQRVMIAMAIACKPDILIADEPTTALDVTVQKEIISLLKELQVQTEMSIIFITHDLTLISEIANRVLVMYQGDIVEQGDVDFIFKKPQHNYTKALINARPSLKTRLKILPTIKDYLSNTASSEIISDQDRKEKHSKLYAKQPLLEVINVEKEYFSKAGLFKKPNGFKAVDNVSFKLFEGETLGLVGESGCGKSTLGNTILQLDKATAGKILYNNTDITKLTNKALKKLRKDIQIIFQDPYSSLNPRMVSKEFFQSLGADNLLSASNCLRCSRYTLMGDFSTMSARLFPCSPLR